MKAGWELGTIFVDLLSFFCVTTDLYGEENLRSLSDRLQKFLSPLKETLLSAVEPPGSSLVVTPEQVSKWPRNEGSETAPLLPPSITPIKIREPWQVYVGLLLRLASLLYAPIMIAVWLLLALVGSGLFLLEKKRAKGLLLVTGTVLFLIEKGVDAVLILSK